MGVVDETDAALIERLLAGQSQAWDELVLRYRRLVYAVPTRMGLCREDAEEVFQDTFLALFRKLASLRERDRVGLWLAVTARRRALDLVGRGSVAREIALDPLTPIADPRPPVDVDLIELEAQARVRQAVSSLSASCRTIIAGLFYVDPPLSYRQIARSLQLAEGSLGPIRRRCLERLRSKLEQHHG